MAAGDSQILPGAEALTESEALARREFLKNVGKAAATAPAVALLLAASSKAASAQVGDKYGECRDEDDRIDTYHWDSGSWDWGWGWLFDGWFRRR